MLLPGIASPCTANPAFLADFLHFDCFLAPVKPTGFAQVFEGEEFLPNSRDGDTGQLVLR